MTSRDPEKSNSLPRYTYFIRVHFYSRQEAKLLLG